MASSSPDLTGAPASRWLAAALAALGALAIAAALVMTPDFAVEHQAIRNELTPERARRLAWLRLGAGALGVGLVLLGLRGRWLVGWLPRASGRAGLPLGGMLAVVGVFAGLFAGNLALQLSGLVRHTARLFPVSVVRAPELHGSGLPWLLAFVGLAVVAARRREAFRGWRAWA
ncbi:MAG: hypothetical protein ACR2P8_08245, partial [Myxococcota bacterium]